MKKTCRLRISRKDYDSLINHMFPGDGGEHGAVLLAGLSLRDNRYTLYVREVHFAKEGSDYVPGKIGHRALSPKFIHRMITRARDERLVYLAVHNHISDLFVGFSDIDFESHERGYPALLQIAKGMPVGALVFGRRSIQADIWFPDHTRLELEQTSVVGKTITRLYPAPRKDKINIAETYDRQVRMFGQIGQAELSECCVGIIGLGGVGSLLAEYLARIGVKKFYLVDSDRVEQSNLSRIVGATIFDASSKTAKIEVAKKLILQGNEKAQVHLIDDDVAKESVAKELSTCDYLFLAADSMRARLVFNALIHQYLIPGAQLGAKIRMNEKGSLAEVMSVNRPVRPGQGCLWCNQLIDTHQLALEAKSDAERKAQAYGVNEPNPSVISLNAISASHAVNDFMLDYLSLRPEAKLYYEHFHFLLDKRQLSEPRRDNDCSECSTAGLRYARADGVPLPCIYG